MEVLSMLLSLAAQACCAFHPAVLTCKDARAQAQRCSQHNGHFGILQGLCTSQEYSSNGGHSTEGSETSIDDFMACNADFINSKLTDLMMSARAASLCHALLQIGRCRGSPKNCTSCCIAWPYRVCSIACPVLSAAQAHLYA